MSLTYDDLVKAGIVRPNTRQIEGEEKEKTLTMLRLTEPTVVTNNQHSWNEDYIIGNLHYSVGYFGDDDILLEVTEIKDDTR